MTRLFGRLGREESGVTAVIVVLSLFAIIGGSMLSIDAGSVWKTRRQVITDTDAAALAAARYIDANGQAACQAAAADGASSAAGHEASSIMITNDPQSYMDGFVVTPHTDCTTGAGRVRVGGRMPAKLTFAPVFGINNIEPFSSSTAQWGQVTVTTGMRPVGICDKTPHFVEWANHLKGDDSTWGQPAADHPFYQSGHLVHRIYFQRGGTPCGVGSGNWAFLDYNDTTNPNGDAALVDWFLNGYPGEVSLGDENHPRDCNPEQTGNQDGCAPKTGAGGNSLNDAFQTLKNNGTVIPISVYDKVVSAGDPASCDSTLTNGSGTNSRFCLAGFLLVRIWGWDHITGQLTDSSYIDLEFIDQWWTGTIGRHQGTDPQVHGVALCGGNYSTTIDEKCDV